MHTAKAQNVKKVQSTCTKYNEITQQLPRFRTSFFDSLSFSFAIVYTLKF